MDGERSARILSNAEEAVRDSVRGGGAVDEKKVVVRKARAFKRLLVVLLFELRAAGFMP